MGSGGMIVMDDYGCMVDVAKFFMDFCREESAEVPPVPGRDRRDVQVARQDSLRQGGPGSLESWKSWPRW